MFFHDELLIVFNRTPSIKIAIRFLNVLLCTFVLSFPCIFTMFWPTGMWCEIIIIYLFRNVCFWEKRNCSKRWDQRVALRNSES